jgi:hypothetical protein
MAQEKVNAEETQVKSGRIKSRVNYDVTIQYDGRDCVVAPRQEIQIPDFSKLGSFNPREILKIEG